MEPGKKIYFASDFHLGAKGKNSSTERERKVIRWLEECSKDAAEIYLVGDVFDFWFEYATVVPKGYIRLLGTIAALTDKGIKVYFFKGNHDMWTFGYFEKELGMKVYSEPIIKEYNGKKFLIGHGDGLGPGDIKYKLLKILFTSRICQWLLARFHPNLVFSIANFWSRKSRITNIKKDEAFEGPEKEWLYQFCKKHRASNEIDYYIFGHRHLPLDLKIEDTTSRYINLGEWATDNCHYAVFDGAELELKTFE
jgi:UDP-2,3-diacylglucosamine hydrolase